MFGKKELFRENLGENLTRVYGKCIFIGEEYSVKVPTDGLEKYLGGVHAQVAMPHVKAEDREFVMSGISPKGWKEKFG